MFATAITSVIVWKVTGKQEIGLSVGVMDCLVKLLTYYFHERAWSSFSFGYDKSDKPVQFKDSAQDFYNESADECEVVLTR